MKKVILAAVIACTIACHKEGDPVADIPGPPAEQQVLVKDIVISGLPAPFYHFEYANSGKIIRASFAADFLVMKIDYDNNMISVIHNSGPANQDQLNYFYDSSRRPVRIDYVNNIGKTYKKIECTYNGLQLQSLKRSVAISNVFVTEKLMHFLYNAGGSLRRVEQHFPAISATNQDAVNFADNFESYDTNFNPEEFSLLHDEFFDNLILLPGIELQPHNPTKVSRSGDGLNYEIEFTYSYNTDRVPIIKEADILILNGSTAGQHIKSRTTFSY